MNLRRRLLISLILSLLLIPVVSAREIRSGQNCEIAGGEVVEGVLIALCETLTIDGMVRGDVFAVAATTHINGIVDGNLYIASAQLDVRGLVTEDIHFGGIVLRVNPPPTDDVPDEDGHFVGGGLKAASLSTVIFDHTRIERTILNVGYQLILHGDASNEVNFWGSTLVIEGAVNGDVYAVVGDPSADSSQIETLLFPLGLDLDLLNPGLTVSESGRIDGSAFYTGPQPAVIDGVITDGEVYEAPPPVLPSLDEPGAFTQMIRQFGQEFASLAIIGLLALFVTNNVIYAPLAQLRSRPFNSLAVGMLAFLLSFPVVLIVIVLTLVILFFFQVIGLSGVVIALGVVLGLINVGGISIFYFLAIFLARALVGLALGRVVLRVLFGRNAIDRRSMLYTALLIGVGLLAVLVSLPAIGWVINATALFFGLGALLNFIIKQTRRLRDESPAPLPAWRTPSPAAMRPQPIRSDLQQANPPQSELQITPPPILERPRLPEDTRKPSEAGMNNLPDGFDWSFFKDDES